MTETTQINASLQNSRVEFAVPVVVFVGSFAAPKKKKVYRLCETFGRSVSEWRLKVVREIFG